LGVLLAVRDAVHSGHRLLLHPFLGNLRPQWAFFRSFVISDKRSLPIEPASISLIENALEVFRGFGAPPSPPERETADLQALDYNILAGGLSRLAPSQTFPREGIDICV
jgi:hypothetical protein